MNTTVLFVIVLFVHLCTAEDDDKDKKGDSTQNSGWLSEARIQQLDQEAYEFGEKVADSLLNSVSDDTKKQLVQSAVGGSGGGITGFLAGKAASSDLAEKAAERYVGNEFKEFTDHQLRELTGHQHHEGQENSNAGHSDQH